MDAESPETVPKPNPRHNAMRFLKQNPPEGSEEGSNASNEKESESTVNEPCESTRPRPVHQMAFDRFGEELAPDATIWGTYLEETQKYDRELVEGRQRSLDTLLLFAVLFAVIITAFLFASKDLLRQDPADASAALLLVIAHSQLRMELGIHTPMHSVEAAAAITEFTPSTAALWANGIWFMSLGLSLSAALITIMAKEWLAALHTSRPRSASRMEFIRQSISRIKGLEDWGALRIIDLLPTLFQMSLLLFSMGFVVYLWALDAALAVVLTGVIGATFAFYFATTILGATCEFCPFVTETSQYLTKFTKPLFRIPSADLNTGSVTTPSIKDLQGIVWLSQRTVDPAVVDNAYQAIAGLHQSPYTIPDLVNPRPNSSPSPNVPTEHSPFDRDMSISSMFSQVEKRFDDLLTGRLETGCREPPVCRYINAMIALRSHTVRSIDFPQIKYWLDLLEKIDRLWSSKLPERSLSGNNFSGVLIAEMDVLKLAMDDLLPILSTKKSTPGKVDDDTPTEGSDDLDSKHQGHPSIDISTIDKATSESLLALSDRLAEWLQLSLKLLKSQADGKTKIAPYVVDGLSRGISDGTYYLKCIYPVLHAPSLFDSTPDYKEKGLECLKTLIFLLSQTTTPSSESIISLVEALKACSCIVPVVLRSLQPQTENSFDQIFNFRDLNLKPPTSRSEVSYISVRYMMILVGYLCSLIPEHPQCEPIFAAAVHLVFIRTDEDYDYDPTTPSPRQAVGLHLGDYIKILEFVGASDSNLEVLKRKAVDHLCIIANYPWTNEPAFGMYIPPSLWIPMMRIFTRSYLVPDTAQRFMETIVKRLRDPTLSLSQLPPQATPIPEPGSTIEYLQQITHVAGAFSALVQAGSNRTTHTNAVTRGIADITIVAANRDPAFFVEPVELRPPAVPGFLEAISWALPHLTSLDDNQNLYKRFVVAASVLLVAASEDQESREQISASTDRNKLLTALRENKDAYLEIVAEGEWHRLVNGLRLGEGNEEAGNNDSDGESDSGPDAVPVPTTSEAIELDIN